MALPFNALRDSDDPPNYHKAITPADGTDLSPTPAALYIAVEGNVEIGDAAGVDVTYAAVPVGLFPFVPTRIKEDTTATVIGWYHTDPG